MRDWLQAFTPLEAFILGWAMSLLVWLLVGSVLGRRW